MIIIRKLSVILILLVVITSLSFTAFAAGEQPSGSSYWYISGTGTTLYGTYWESVTKSLFYMGQDVNSILGNLPSGSSYSYYNGSSRSSNYWTALTSGISYIGLQTYTMSGDTSSIKSYTSDIKSDVSNIKSQLPTSSGYGYTNNSGTFNTSSYWVASNNTLGYIQDRASSILTKITSLDNKFIDYTTLLTAIKTSTQSIDTNVSLIESDTSSIDTNTSSIKSNTDTLKSDVSSFKPKINSIDSNLASIVPQITNNYNFPRTNNYAWVQPDGTITSSTTSTATYWRAITYTLVNMATDINDLHTMFASPEDLALKADQENNISSATTNFLSGNDSATSVGTGSIGKVKDLGDGAASFFDTGVNATSLFTLLSDNSNDGPWTWFTQAVADDLDAVAAANRNSRSNSSSESVVDFYSDKMADLDKLLGSIAEVDSRKSENYVYTASDFQQDPYPWEVDVID